MGPCSRVGIVADLDEFFRLGVGETLKRDLHFSCVDFVSSYNALLTRREDTDCIKLIIIEASLLNWDSNLSTLRRNYPLARIAITSTSKSRELALRSIDYGAHGHVLKGGSVSDLSLALRMILDGLLWLPDFVSCLDKASDLGEPHFKNESHPGSAQLLTARQLEVLQMVVQGKSNKEIARKLALREGTIKVHMAGLFRNLCVTNRASAAVIGARLLSERSAPDAGERRSLIPQHSE